MGLRRRGAAGAAAVLGGAVALLVGAHGVPSAAAKAPRAAAMAPRMAAGHVIRQLYLIDTGRDRGWLVLQRREKSLVLATQWTVSEGTCFAGVRSGRWFHGTFTALPGPSSAWVRLRPRFGGVPTRLLVDQRARDYSRTKRVWTRTNATEVRRLFDLPATTSFTRQVRACR